MSLAVTESKESADAILERCIEYRAGWLKMDYQCRDDALQHMNVVEYVDKIGMPVPNDPSQPPLANYRYYFDMNKFAELRSDPTIDATTTEEMKAMPSGADVPTFFLEQYQLKECALCQKRGIKLSLCAGCRSFVYCCSECQVTDWKAKHKFVCLKRKVWEEVKK